MTHSTTNIPFLVTTLLCCTTAHNYHPYYVARYQRSVVYSGGRNESFRQIFPSERFALQGIPLSPEKFLRRDPVPIPSSSLQQLLGGIVSSDSAPVTAVVLAVQGAVVKQQ